jgi:hypothetical protein
MGIATGVLAADDELLKELKALQLQARQLERDAREYRDFIEMLEADPAANPSKENALLALQNQLERAEAQLEENAREQAVLEKTLDPESAADDAGQTGRTGLAATAATEEGAARPTRRPDAVSAGATRAAPWRTGGESSVLEAARLAELLSGYYGAADASGDNGAEPAAAEFDESKVTLNGREGRVAIDLIAERLARGPQSMQREVDIIFHVEVRRDGRLVDSSSYSLNSLGKAQYIAKIGLPRGEATIRVRRDIWKAKLDGAAEAEYLFTLDMPAYGDARLHVIPVEELRKAGIADPPYWLPSLGDATPDSS